MSLHSTRALANLQVWVLSEDCKQCFWCCFHRFSGEKLNDFYHVKANQLQLHKTYFRLENLWISFNEHAWTLFCRCSVNLFHLFKKTCSKAHRAPPVACYPRTDSPCCQCRPPSRPCRAPGQSPWAYLAREDTPSRSPARRPRWKSEWSSLSAGEDAMRDAAEKKKTTGSALPLTQLLLITRLSILP